MKINLPHVGESVTEGIIGSWLKKVGDPVEKYDPLVEVVTDKVSMEMPSPVSGILTAILVEEGSTVPMGTAIAEISVGDEEKQADSTLQTDKFAESFKDPIDRTGVLLKNVDPVGPTGSGGLHEPIHSAHDDNTGSNRKSHSPAVRHLAMEHSVDLSLVTGTGLKGRITRKDILAFIDSEHGLQSNAPIVPAQLQTTTPSPEQPDDDLLDISPVRRMISNQMVRSAAEIPQAWTIIEVDVTNMVTLRGTIKSDFFHRESVNITYLSFVIKAVAESLKENPLLNSSWQEDSIILKRHVNIGIAVAAPQGLMVPVIHDADSLSIAGLAKATDILKTKALNGNLSIADVQDGTFTVNNTGALGSVASQPLINYPQAAILTTEAIVERPVVVNNAIAIRSIMNVCLAFDHRIMDGLEASLFARAVKVKLESIGSTTSIY